MRLWKLLVDGVNMLTPSTFAEVLSALPSAGVAGRTLHRSSDKSFWGDTGTGWVRLSPKIGEIRKFGSTNPDSGWILCDGAAIIRTGSNAALFAEIGTAYGAGNGSTTFNVPNYTNRFPTGNTPGSTGGANTVDISHLHSIDPPATASSTPSATTNFSTLLGVTPAGTDTHTHTVDIPAFNSATAGNAAFDNRPAFTGAAHYIYAGV